MIGCSTNTLYKYLDEGRLKASRGTADQGRFRIPQTSLEEFLGTPLAEETKQNETKAIKDNLPAQAGLPIKLVRSLIFVSLLLILIDIIVTKSVLITTQLTRLFFLTIALLLAYQEGGYHRTAA
ncbi:MAG: helix-turn-helix domain-containing protein [Candidatus Beckwithbacteria bacterium]|nr:helix-turn-helix domain-containing protein [Candidatus Beckwithbacteria bacterium]